MKLTKSDLAKFCPRPTKGKAYQTNWDGYTDALVSDEGFKLFAQYGLTGRAELCAFLANSAEETGDHGGFTALWENMYFPSVANIRRTWPGRAAKYSDAWIKTNLVGNPAALADWAYGGRMGNGPNGSGDGYKYRGFGILQTTGKTDHVRFLKGDYSYLSALRAALLEWASKGCGDHMRNGQFDTVCILINGGTNGLAQRRMYYKRALSVWTEDPDWTVEAPAPVAVAVEVEEQDDDPNNDETSITLPPFIPADMKPEMPALPMPSIVTSTDLKGVSRKVDLLTKVRAWFAGLGVAGSGLGIADLQQGATTIHSITPILKENSLFIIAGMGFGTLALIGVLIAYCVEDYNSKRWQPSGGG